jgi:carboxyl-terminal processing protease
MKVAKVLPVSLLALALTAPVAWLTAQADAGSPSAEQATAAKLVYGLLSDSRYAYRPRALDDKLSAEVFKRYLESLDPGKLFFTAADVAKLEGYRARLDDAIKSGEVGPAFEIFNLYQARVKERVVHARALLDKDIFAFEGSDRWEYDREHAPWATDAAELDTLWQQSVRNDWLRLKLAGKAPEEIRKTLDKRYASTPTRPRSTRIPITSTRARPNVSSRA